MLNGLGEDEKHHANSHCRAKRRQISRDAHLLVDALTELVYLSF